MNRHDKRMYVVVGCSPAVQGPSDRHGPYDTLTTTYYNLELAPLLYTQVALYSRMVLVYHPTVQASARAIQRPGDQAARPAVTSR